MSEPADNDFDMKDHIIAHFDHNAEKWKRLETIVSEARTVPDEELAAVKALQKQKTFSRWSVRRSLARIRRKYRKSYRKQADHMVKEWRPNYESRLAKVRPYQQDISRIARHEIRNLQTIHGILKKVNTVCDNIRKRFKK